MNQIKLFVGGLVLLALASFGWFLSWQGHEIETLRKAKVDLEANLLAAQEAEKVRVVERKVYVAAEGAKSEIQDVKAGCTNEPELIGAWADGIKRVRGASQGDNP